MIPLLLPFIFGQVTAGCSGNGLTDQQIQGFLNGHNMYRALIAQGKYNVRGVTMPPAADMPELQWDCDLAATAAQYASTCPRDHSHWRGLGENLYWKWSTAPFDWNTVPQIATESWINEFQQYGWPNLVFDGKNMKIGHATQMMWSGTNRVGCAIANCPGNRMPYGAAVVCQYHPQGNILRNSNYQPGQTCSACQVCNANNGLCMQ